MAVSGLGLQGLSEVKYYSSTIAELSKSLRKCLSVVISFVVYSKPVTQMHLIGGGLSAPRTSDEKFGTVSLNFHMIFMKFYKKYINLDSLNEFQSN